MKRSMLREQPIWRSSFVCGESNLTSMEIEARGRVRLQPRGCPVGHLEQRCDAQAVRGAQSEDRRKMNEMRARNEYEACLTHCIQQSQTK